MTTLTARRLRILEIDDEPKLPSLGKQRAMQLLVAQPDQKASGRASSGAREGARSRNRSFGLPKRSNFHKLPLRAMRWRFDITFKIILNADPDAVQVLYDASRGEILNAIEILPSRRAG